MLALVLGGGAAKGYAHIGVIKLLEELNIKPELVVGASMGALVSAFYAAGYQVKEIEDIACQIDGRKKNSLFPIRLNARGLINGKAIVRHLSQYLGNKKIEELPIKYAAVTTDIEEHKELVITTGDLVQAVRAAISIPVVFIPHHYQGRILVDGGFVNPVPVDVAVNLGATRIIAVNVLRYINYESEILTSTQAGNAKFNMRSVATEVFDYVFSRLIDFSVSKASHCLLMNINTGGIKLTQFERARFAIELGYQEALIYREKLARFVIIKT